jgi:hypothetical protein
VAKPEVAHAADDDEDDMAITRLGWGARFEAGPSTPPAVQVTRVLQGGREGNDFRLADDPKVALVRIVGSRAQLGPCAGVIGGGAPEATLDVETDEFPVLAGLARTWRERRIEWAGHVLGSRGVAGIYRQPALRYRAGSWKPDKLEDSQDWHAGETTYHAQSPVDSESFGPARVELVLQNKCGERVGIVVRAGADRCVTLVRGSMVISRRWPASTDDFSHVARLLVSASSDGQHAGLAQLEEATEFDSFTAAVLEEAAAYGRRGSV